MNKAKLVVDRDGKFYGIRINCPGCRWAHDNRPSAHILQVDWTPLGYERSPHMRPDLWSFNGDLQRPVFGPSLLMRSDRGEERTPYVCHSFIGCQGAEPGQIKFLSDCTHDLANQIVDLPDIE